MYTGLSRSYRRHNLQIGTQQSSHCFPVPHRHFSALPSSPHRPQICKGPLLHIKSLSSQQLAQFIPPIQTLLSLRTSTVYDIPYICSTPFRSSQRSFSHLSSSSAFTDSHRRAYSTAMASSVLSDTPHANQRQVPVERITDKLETSSLDDRSYRVVKLSNQMEVLLVHDAETDKASAALDVNVGNFSDPADMPGMPLSG